MKTFNDVDSAMEWIKRSVIQVGKQAIPEIAKEIYKDSRKYIFYDTGDMYNSGQQSPFNKGFVVIKAPQVRRLYYTNWVKHPTNPNSRVQWFEVVKSENKAKYSKMYADMFIKEVSK